MQSRASPVTNLGREAGFAVVQGNLIRNLFFRKDVDSRGIGIAVEADSVVSGNVVEGAPAFGILIGWGSYLRDISVTDNLIRDSHIGIGVSSAGGGTALITDNMITGAKDGAIRAMDGAKPVGPDLAQASAEAYRNLAIYANVARRLPNSLARRMMLLPPARTPAAQSMVRKSGNRFSEKIMLKQKLERCRDSALASAHIDELDARYARGDIDTGGAAAADWVQARPCCRRSSIGASAGPRQRLRAETPT